MKKWNTIFSLAVFTLLCFITYETKDGFYAVLSFSVAWYLLYKARAKAFAWLNKVEEK